MDCNTTEGRKRNTFNEFYLEVIFYMPNQFIVSSSIAVESKPEFSKVLPLDKLKPLEFNSNSYFSETGYTICNEMIKRCDSIKFLTSS